MGSRNGSRFGVGKLRWLTWMGEGFQVSYIEFMEWVIIRRFIDELSLKF